MREEFTDIFNIGGKEIKVTTGKMAWLASGAVTLQVGGTTLLATATVDKVDTELDYLPLGVEYIEKMYARGAISGSRFQKREGFPSEEAIVRARQVDHSVRSLFPKSFKRATGIVLTVLSYDGENDPETLAVLGASLALILSQAPFFGPASGVIACIDEKGNIVINPGVEKRDEFKGEFVVSGIDGKILNIEGWAKEVPEEVMSKLLDESLKEIESINKLQREFAKKLGVSLATLEESDFDDLPASEELIEKVKELKYDTIKEALFVGEKQGRNEKLFAIKKDLQETFTNEIKDGSRSALDIDKAVEYIARKIVRKAVLEEDKRVSPRGLDEIRELKAEVDILPTVHGSALFSRGLTQSLAIVTLGPKSNELMIDGMEGEDTKSFMHHYNMPAFSTGEAGRYDYKPNRREIGHGSIGENALKKMVPNGEEFPYTIRVVSETMTSNGSTSMAATCASSMALMAAGVPIKEAVGGISVGLVTEDDNEDTYKLILDIEGIEDFYGDMDFKVCGTKNGVTAIQYENKLRGVKLEVLKKAFELAKVGRMQVLEIMGKAITEPRKELAENAPIVKAIKIKKDEIGALIGPGGKVIRELVEKSLGFAKEKVDISVDEDGVVLITASNKKQLDFIESIVSQMFEKAEVGKVYDGVVSKVADYGIFVDVNSNISGLNHISEIVDRRLSADDLKKMFSEGQKVKVKVKSIDETGRLSFTMKNLQSSDVGQQ